MRAGLRDLHDFGQFAVAELVARLPSVALREVAIGTLARVAYQLSRRKRRLIERNIAHAFAGGLDPILTRRITIGCFREFWPVMTDWVPAVGARLPAAEIEIRGLTHLHQALARGNGAILWESNGFSRRVQAKRTLHAHGIPVHQTHGATHVGVLLTEGEGTWLRNRLMRPTYERRESAFVAELLIIPVHWGMATGRDYSRRLRQNAVLCMAGDGRIARKQYPIEFLGQSVSFAPGAVKLARFAGAPLLPMFWAPTADGAPALEIDPSINPRASGDEDKVITDCLQQFADALAARIMRWPEAYRNWHLVVGRDNN